MGFFNSFSIITEIIRLEETCALLSSLIFNIIFYLKILQLEIISIYCCNSFFAGRLLKENLFFKENNVLKPKMRFYSYFFILNLFFDIIANILFIFLSKYRIYIFIIKGYNILKFLIFISTFSYYNRQHSKCFKKEQESKEYADKSIKKILETNPNFFVLPESIIQGYKEPKYEKILKPIIYFLVILFLRVLLHPHF